MPARLKHESTENETDVKNVKILAWSVFCRFGFW